MPIQLLPLRNNCSLLLNKRIVHAHYILHMNKGFNYICNVCILWFLQVIFAFLSKYKKIPFHLNNFTVKFFLYKINRMSVSLQNKISLTAEPKWFSLSPLPQEKSTLKIKFPSPYPEQIYFKTKLKLIYSNIRPFSFEVSL